MNPASPREFMRILVIAPHPDDESIGCGGTVCKHSKRGDRTVAVFLTSGELGLKQVSRAKARRIREAEARAAAKFLGMVQLEFLRLPDWTLSEHIKSGARLLRPILKKEKPELIYVPHPLEWHPDHRVAVLLLRTALRGARLASPEIRGYEVWTPLPEYDHLENITTEMPRKCRALRAHRSQLDEFDYERAVRGLNQFRGELAGKCRYAEVFKTLSPDSLR
jgi:LmbE family N-acetylglucosaminyl deacetylase